MVNVCVSIFFFVFLIFSYLLTFQFPKVAGIFSDPALYPRAIMLILFMLNGVLFYHGIKDIKKKTNEGKEVTGKRRDLNIKKPLIVLVNLLIYFILLNYFGFMVSTLLFLIVIYMIYGGKLKFGLLYTVLMTIGLYVLFEMIFKIPFFPKYPIW